MNKAVALNMDFSNLEKRALASYKSQAKALMLQQMAQLVVTGKSVVTTKDMVISTPTNDLADAMLYGLNISSVFGDEFYIPPEPHCQRKAFKAIDKFWSNNHMGLYGLYVNQLTANPRTKDVFKGRSTTHHYPWYKRGSKY